IARTAETAVPQGNAKNKRHTHRMLRSAVERQCEIIGEAMTRLRAKSPELVERVTDYRKIISFRNVLIHGYDTVSDEITWRIVVEKLPILQRELEELLKS
ncbi:MAG TPA: HepT-like ribonuclease domain-containing protein, partial [Tepidisphaeraceae bacterium]